jgi:hypothetical protein
MKQKYYNSESDSDSDSSVDSNEERIINKMNKLSKKIHKHQNIHGGKIKIAKAFSNMGKTLKTGFEDVSGREFKSPEQLREDFKINDIRNTGKMVGNKTSSYVTSKRGGLASDLVKYGIPATVGGVFGALGTVAGLNPVGGVAATALGTKLGAVAANQITKKTGVGLRKCMPDDAIHIDIGSHNAKRDIVEGGKLKMPRRRSTQSSLQQYIENMESRKDKELKKNLLKMSKSLPDDIKAIKQRVGAGIKPKKGSPEMREKMARIRAMKKN